MFANICVSSGRFRAARRLFCVVGIAIASAKGIELFSDIDVQRVVTRGDRGFQDVFSLTGNASAAQHSVTTPHDEFGAA